MVEAGMGWMERAVDGGPAREEGPIPLQRPLSSPSHSLQ